MSRMENQMSGQGDAGSSGNEGTAASLRDTAGQVGENLRNLGSQVRDTATEQYGQLRDQASDYYEQGRQRATDWEHSLESYVQEKPIQAVMIAAGVGVLLGLLWERS